MKLYSAPIAPNPMRVEIFLKEKNIFEKFEIINLDVATDTKMQEHIKRNILRELPVLELDDGRFLSESRAICSYLEGIFPEPCLMGENSEKRAFIEMYDRQAEFGVLYNMMQWVRHTHPKFDRLEKVQVAQWAEVASQKAKYATAAFDDILSKREFVAGDEFSIADITLYCGINFGRLAKYKAWEEFENINKWYEKIIERKAFKI